MTEFMVESCAQLLRMLDTFTKLIFRQMSGL